MATCRCGGQVEWDDKRGGEVCRASGDMVIGPLGTKFPCSEVVESKTGPMSKRGIAAMHKPWPSKKGNGKAFSPEVKP